MDEVDRPPRKPRDIPLAIEEMSIQAFRGLENVRLQNLRRINLLVGTNNAGKTSILEAIAVLQNPFSPFEWSNIVRAREVRTIASFPDQFPIIDSLRWMFPISNGDVWGEKDPNPISLFSRVSGSTDRLKISCELFRGMLEPEQVRKAMVYRTHSASEPTEDHGIILRASAYLEQGMIVPIDTSREWALWSTLGLRSEPRREPPRANVQFLAPYAHRSSSANLRRLTEASKLGWRDDVDALLRDLDARIAGVEIITSEDGRFPRIAIRMRNGSLMPQVVLGDGVRRALSIALALRSASNGLLLIDEIEAALHVSALDRVYRWLDDAVTNFSVQIFATTHSLEAIDAITRNASSSSHSDLSGYALDTSEENGVKRYTGGMLHRLVHQRGLDIRG